MSFKRAFSANINNIVISNHKNFSSKLDQHDHNSNLNSISRFTVEQITFLQIIIAIFVKISINNAIIQIIAVITINFEIKFVFVDNQIAISRHARFVRTLFIISQLTIVQRFSLANQIFSQSEPNSHTNNTELNR